MPLLPQSFYTRPDVVQIARELLGKELFTSINGDITSGVICETEAYAGTTDKASHAFGCRRTRRTEIMYGMGGTAYVYLCYGMHSLFNVVTNARDIPHAVLIRGIIPARGTSIMLDRTRKPRITKDIGIGPGKVSKLLGIHFSHSGIDICSQFESDGIPAIWIEDSGVRIDPIHILTGPRIGVDYAGEDALLPYRFFIRLPEGGI
ncbi:MAG: DNA-3-methyladenine glycosylase [Bacteroidales bacterium]